MSMAVQRIVQTSDRHRTKVKKIAEQEAKKDKLHLMESILMQTVKLNVSKELKLKAVRDFLIDEANHFEIREKNRLQKYTEIVKKRVCELYQKERENREATKLEAKKQEEKEKQKADDDCRERKREAQKEHNLPRLDLHDPKTDPWALMNIMNMIDIEESHKRDHLKVVQGQKAMASNLSKQVEEKNASHQKEIEENQKYLLEQNNRIAGWRKEQMELENSERKNSDKLRRERQEQIEQCKIRRKREARELRESELQRMEDIKKELDADENQRISKIMEERERLERVKLENIENDKVKEKERKEEAILDATLMKDYKDKLDKQEQNRVEEFNARLARYEKIALQREEAGFNKRERERVLKIERKILQEALAKEKADDLKEKRKKEMKILKQRKINETNQQLSDEKARQRQLAKLADEKFAVAYRKEIEEILKEEQAKKDKRKDIDKKHCLRLFDQIKSREQTHETHMTRTEMSINREILKRIENDPALRQKVEEKLAKQRNPKDVIQEF